VRREVSWYGMTYDECVAPLVAYIGDVELIYELKDGVEMSNIVETIDCDTLRDFWEKISPVGNLFGGSPSFVYRGQRLSTWELTPRVFRKEVIAETKHGLFKTAFADHPFQTFFEYALLREFLNFCDLRGLMIPGDSPDFRKYMDHGVMNIHSIQNTNWPDEQIRPLMALAQHHGVPTRLLDVSNNPYVASYFAASSAVAGYFAITSEQERAEYSTRRRLAVFGLDVGSLHLAAGIEAVRVPGSTSPNISAQGGSFLLVKNAGNRGELFTEDVSLESKLVGLQSSLSLGTGLPIAKPLLIKLTLPMAYAPEVLAWCRRFGISAATIFPGYDGAAKAVLEFSAEQRFQAAQKPSSALS